LVITDDAQSYFGGRLDAKVVSSGDFVTDELLPSVQMYRLFEEKTAAKPEKPAA
jgi:hypothetical protein